MSMVDMVSGLGYDKEAFIGQGLIGKGLFRVGKLFRSRNLIEKGLGHMESRGQELFHKGYNKAQILKERAAYNENMNKRYNNANNMMNTNWKEKMMRRGASPSGTLLDPSPNIYNKSNTIKKSFLKKVKFTAPEEQPSFRDRITQPEQAKKTFQSQQPEQKQGNNPSPEQKQGNNPSPEQKQGNNPSPEQNISPEEELASAKKSVKKGNGFFSDVNKAYKKTGLYKDFGYTPLIAAGGLGAYALGSSNRSPQVVNNNTA